MPCQAVQRPVREVAVRGDPVPDAGVGELQQDGAGAPGEQDGLGRDIRDSQGAAGRWHAPILRPARAPSESSADLKIAAEAASDEAP